MNIGSRKFLAWLLGALLVAVGLVPCPARAAAEAGPLRLRIRLVTPDGARITNLPYHGMLRLEVLGPGKGPRHERALSLDRGGEAESYLHRPGRYGLKLMGIPVARFKVVRGEDGLQAEGLSGVLKLPFTHVLEIGPPRRPEKYRDPRTGKERTRLVPVPMDWSRVRVGRAGQKAATGRAWPYKFGKYTAGVAAPKGGVAMVTAPGCAPVVVPLRTPPPGRAGDLGRRRVSVGLMPVSFDPDKPAETRGVPGGYVYNVNKRILWWLRKVTIDKKDHWYLLAYRLKDRMGSVVPLRLPPSSRRAGKPKLYLDERGDLHAFRQDRDAGGKLVRQCFKLSPEGVGTAAPECVYPDFFFHGQVYRNGGIWVIPNVGGVPLEVGNNSILIWGTARTALRTIDVSHTYNIRVEGPVPRVVGKVPSTKCTGSIPGGGEDGRWCLDPPMDSSIDAEMVTGKANFGGVDLVYAGPEEFKLCVEEGPDRRCRQWNTRKVVISGLPPLRPYIGLIDSSTGWTGLKGPLNLRQGPYPELRYLAKRVDPATHKVSSRYEVVKLYPWNYRVRTLGRRIVVDRSAILSPAPPPAGEQEQAGALLEVLSPATEDRHPLSGPEAEIRIRLRYELAGAPQGTLRVSVEHDSGVLLRRSYNLPAPGGEREISFRTSRPGGSSQLVVELELVPAGAQGIPAERLYYYFSIGAFTVEVETEEPVVAHPKNRTRLTLTMKDSEGKPLANRQFDVMVRDPEVPWLQGGYLERPGGGSARVTTDAAGQVKLLFIPPLAAKSAQGAPLGSFPVRQELEVRAVGESEQRARAALELVSPWPRITKLALPGGDLAGHWQGSDSRVVVADADSRTFNITIYGPGEFGYKGGHGRQENLEVLDAASPFHFRFKSRPLGLDLNDIPSNWDMFKDFGATNAKVLGRLALLLGGKWLLRQHAVTGTPKTVTHTSQVTKVYGGGDKLSKIGGRLGSDIDTTIVTKVKIMTEFENALPQSTWATDLLGDADAMISITKNTAEVANAAGQSRMDLATAGNMGPAHDLDAALDGMHAGVGVVDTMVTIRDMVTGAPMDLQLELLKGVYENAKMFYNWHRKFQTVADSWEDVIFVPILVEVADHEGHRARRLGRLAVKFSKEMGHQ